MADDQQSSSSNSSSGSGAVRSGLNLAKNIASAPRQPWKMVPIIIVVIVILTFIVTMIATGDLEGADLSSSTDTSSPPPDTGGGSGGETGSVTPLAIADVPKYIVIDYQGDSTGYSKNGVVAGEHATDAQKNYIYGIFAKALGAEKYRDLLHVDKYGPIHIFFFNPIGNVTNGITGGAGYGPTDMAFFGFLDSHLQEYTKEHIMIHESGHILDQRNGTNELGMNLSDLNKDGSACYDTVNTSGGLAYINTYGYRGGEGGNGGVMHETFADGMADNFSCAPGNQCEPNLPFDGGHIKAIQDYPNKCPKTFAFFRDNIWGADFYAPTVSQDELTNTVGQTTGSVAPNTDDCKGKLANAYWNAHGYPLSLNPTGQNFGDPNCSFTYEGLFDLLKQQDSSNACIWYRMVSIESGYDPNDWYRCDQNGNNCTPNPYGAWGLFQMGSAKKNNDPILDRGDVEWHTQTSNAVQYVAKHNGGSLTAYFQSARTLANTSSGNGQSQFQKLKSESSGATKASDCEL